MSTFSQKRVLREPILLILIMVHGYPDSQVRVNKTVDARQPKHLFTNSEFKSADQKTTCIYMHATTVTVLASKKLSILESESYHACSSNLSATTRISCELLTSNIVIGGPDALRNSEVRGDCQEPKDHSHGAECGSGRCHAETSNGFPAT